MSEEIMGLCDICGEECLEDELACGRDSLVVCPDCWDAELDSDIPF